MSETEKKDKINQNNNMDSENLESIAKKMDIQNEQLKENKKNKGKDPKKDKIIDKLKEMSKDDLINKYLKIVKENNKLNEELSNKKNEISEYLNKYRRLLADMENLRKRTMTEKQDSLKYANFNIIGDLLVVLDDFQRAIDSSRNDEKMELSHFVEGIEMIEKQFIDLLFKKYGVEKYCEKGDEFDPTIHLAMTAEEGDYKNETVIEVFRSGYKLHDRVIRAAEVKVGKPKE